MNGFANQYPELALVAFAKDFGIVEVGGYEFGYFGCITHTNEYVELLPFELQPLNLHTEHYIMTQVLGENAWWVRDHGPLSTLVYTLTQMGMPIPSNLHMLSNKQIAKLYRAATIDEEREILA